MKKKLLIILLLPGFLFFACEKEHGNNDHCDSFCEKGECSTCEDSDFENPDKLTEGITKYIVEPLVVSQECGCIVSGMVKYVKNDKTMALVKYGDGKCDNYAIKILCFDGNCDSKKAKVCKFTMKCKTGKSPTAEAGN